MGNPDPERICAGIVERGNAGTAASLKHKAARLFPWAKSIIVI
jgi:hypothetical protein